MDPKNTKECDKRNSSISSELRMIYIYIYISSDNVRYPVIKTFTTLHYTLLHLTTLHFLSFKTSPNYTSLQFTTLVDTSLPLI